MGRGRSGDPRVGQGCVRVLKPGQGRSGVGADLEWGAGLGWEGSGAGLGLGESGWKVWGRREAWDWGVRSGIGGQVWSSKKEEISGSKDRKEVGKPGAPRGVGGRVRGGGVEEWAGLALGEGLEFRRGWTRIPRRAGRGGVPSGMRREQRPVPRGGGTRAHPGPAPRRALRPCPSPRRPASRGCPEQRAGAAGGASGRRGAWGCAGARARGRLGAAGEAQAAAALRAGCGLQRAAVGSALAGAGAGFGAGAGAWDRAGHGVRGEQWPPRPRPWNRSPAPRPAVEITQTRPVFGAPKS